NSSIPKIAEEVRKRAYQGRVSIGHVTKLSAMTAEQKKKMFNLLLEAKITLTVLPATDIFLNGRDYRKLIPRGMVNANEIANFGIRTTISSNNILNAFTPFGDASLLRMGNMYANIAQIAKDDELEEVYRMIGENAARLLGMYKPIKEGSPATLLILETNSSIDAVRSIAQPIAGFKNGRQTFSNEPAIILKTE
ncbi:amidohydrolase family protein, partial [Christiangramia marina]|uniref:amidohydrolase family protein n=1 Tax=Christiangramia marina TaxID=409436 RepID=UPI003AA96AB6